MHVYCDPHVGLCTFLRVCFCVHHCVHVVSGMLMNEYRSVVVFPVCWCICVDAWVLPCAYM